MDEMDEDDNKSYEIVEDEGVVVDSESLSSKISGSGKRKLISQRKLFVWKVFQDDPLDVNFAICGKCNLRIGLTKSKNTQSMWNHLSSAHKDVFRQLKLEEVEDPTRKKHIKTDTILKATIGFFTKNYISFAAVESEHFRKFCSTLDPNYRPISRHSLRDNTVDAALKTGLIGSQLLQMDGLIKHKTHIYV